MAKSQLALLFSLQGSEISDEGLAHVLCLCSEVQTDQSLESEAIWPAYLRNSRVGICAYFIPVLYLFD